MVGLLLKFKLARIREAINNFNLAHDFESAISICQNLVFECEKSEKNSNLKSASKYLATSALLYKNLATVQRISPLYYAVYFYRSGHPSYMDGATFVYRINENQNFTQFTDVIRAQFPSASLLLPGSRTPIIKPVQIIKFLPTLPGIELDKFEPSIDTSDHTVTPTITDEMKYKPLHHAHLTTFYTYLESGDSDITSADAVNTLQVWNRNFVPSYLVDAATFAIPDSILNSSSLAPIAPPIHRVQMICGKGTYLPGVSRHVRIAHRFTSLVPAAQACIEWIHVQTCQLTWLIYIFYKRGKTGADWCGVCAKRDKTECEKSALAKVLNSDKAAPKEEEQRDWKEIEASAAGLLVSLEDIGQSKVAERYLRHVLHNILNEESNQVVGLKKCRFVLEQENLRKDQMLAKIKQETGKAYIKERKRCQELGLEIPQKPEMIDLVQDPLSAELEGKLNAIRILLEYAILLHFRMASDLISDGEGEIESGMEAHGELEILFNKLL